MSDRNTSADLIARLRAAHSDVIGRLGHLLKPDEQRTVYGEAADQIQNLEEALADLESMYARTWDQVDGALVMMPNSIPLFEAAHKKARAALGIPFVEIE